jgi:hypothetical protein
VAHPCDLFGDWGTIAHGWACSDEGTWCSSRATGSRRVRRWGSAGVRAQRVRGGGSADCDTDAGADADADHGAGTRGEPSQRGNLIKEIGETAGIRETESSDPGCSYRSPGLR